MATTTRNNVEQAVNERYSRAAASTEKSLCCPADYDPRHLDVIPEEILERDYGCGDPSRYLRPGETVVDLGSGAGKICYIASQIVGPAGTVIGVDMNDDMLALARKHQRSVTEALGFGNVRFHKGRIQDLALDYEKLETRIDARPIRTLSDLEELEAWKRIERRERPMIPTASVDVVVSNCVLNLVEPDDKATLFREMFRVLKRGGRAVISDIVCDEDVPAQLRDDRELWSGCVSGAFREDLFLKAFEEVGFYGIEILARNEKAWRTIEGIEFRSVTVQAFRGKEGPCLERMQAVVYKGPWKSVTDDDGHTLYRGLRMAVCDKTFHIYTSDPYKSDIEPIPPYEDIPVSQAAPFNCRKDAIRHPRETKGTDYAVTEVTDEPCCGPDGNCG